MAGMVMMRIAVLFSRGLVPLAGGAGSFRSGIAAIFFLAFASILRQRPSLFTFMLRVSDAPHAYTRSWYYSATRRFWRDAAWHFRMELKP